LVDGFPEVTNMNIPPELVLLFLVLTIYWTVRGLIQIFQRHNSILVVLYIIFLFPVAYIHMFILGVFGSSKKKRILKQAKEKVQFDKFVEQEKNK
jgi:hypothetical protein